ncbi:hypothetical protein [Rehaibacterium terrae]|uniref:hypothetical protein n=3 Tax=Rehaibacterium terrae TaxID=1341696 RepID=UPI00391DC65A
MKRHGYSLSLSLACLGFFGRRRSLAGFARAVVLTVAAAMLTSPSTSRASWVAWDDPASSTHEILLENGVSIVLDAGSQQIRIRDGAGNQWDVPFAEAAAQLASDPDAQAQLIQGWMTELQGIDRLGASTGYAWPTLGVAPTHPNEPPPGEVGIQGAAGGDADRVEMAERHESDGYATAGGYGGDPSQWQCAPPRPCNCTFGLCSPYVTPDGSGGQRFFYYLLDEHAPSQPLTEAQQVCRAMHADLWQQQRQGACDQVRRYRVSLYAAALTVVSACPATIITPLAAVGCAAGVMGLYGVHRDVLRAAEGCFAPYPGAPTQCGP